MTDSTMGKRKRTGKTEAGQAQPALAEGRTRWIAGLRHPAAHAAALALLGLGAYWRSLRNLFASDDLYQLFGNPLVRDWRNVWTLFTQSVWAFLPDMPTNYYRPLHLVIYAGVYWFFGYAPYSYHLLMVLAHAAATVLIYLLARKALGDWRGALLAGALFAVHPIHSEAVMWVASVPDLFMTVFVLGGLYLFARADGHPGPGSIVGIVLLYLAALLTKETAR